MGKLEQRIFDGLSDKEETNFTPFTLKMESKNKNGFEWTNHYQITKKGDGQWPAFSVMTPLLRRTSVISVVVKTNEAELTYLNGDPSLPDATIRTILEMEDVVSVTVNHIRGKEVLRKIDYDPELAKTVLVES